MFRKLNASIAARIKARAGGPSPAKVRIDDHGIHVEMSSPSRSTEHIDWKDVQAIDVSQQDVYSHRLIELALATSDRLLQVDESIDGWPELLDGIRQYLPGSTPFERWFTEMPAAHQQLRIYSRQR